MAPPPPANIYYPGSQQPPHPTVTSTYQAEDAVVSGCTIDTNHLNYNGTGFVNFPITNGYVQWNNVDGGAGGLTTIRFRYALGTTALRTGLLTINGSAQSITFTTTGTWDTWSI